VAPPGGGPRGARAALLGPAAPRRAGRPHMPQSPEGLGRNTTAATAPPNQGHKLKYDGCSPEKKAFN